MPRSLNTCHETGSLTSSQYAVVLLFGPPGSGKGTVGKAIHKLPGFVHCSSGDLIRSAVEKKRSKGESWAQVAQGELIADCDLWRAFDSHLTTVISDADTDETLPILVVDGIPRNASQVNELAKRVTVRGIVLLDCLGPETLLERILGRSVIEGRADDSHIEVIKRRLQLFFETTLPLLDAYPASIVHQINASQPPAFVLSDVMAKMAAMKLV